MRFDIPDSPCIICSDGNNRGRERGAGTILTEKAVETTFLL